MYKYNMFACVKSYKKNSRDMRLYLGLESFLAGPWTRPETPLSWNLSSQALLSSSLSSPRPPFLEVSSDMLNWSEEIIVAI